MEWPIRFAALETHVTDMCCGVKLPARVSFGGQKLPCLGEREGQYGEERLKVRSDVSIWTFATNGIKWDTTNPYDPAVFNSLRWSSEGQKENGPQRLPWLQSIPSAQLSLYTPSGRRPLRPAALHILLVAVRRGAARLL